MCPERGTQLIAPGTVAVVAAALAFAVQAAGQASAPPPAKESVNVCLPQSGSRSWCGDDGPPTDAKLAGPSDVAVARDRSLLVADTLNNVIRRIRPNSIVSIAGTGAEDSAVKRRAAERAGFSAPRGVAATGDGGVLVADTGNDAVRLISADGIVETLVARAGPIKVELESPSDVVSMPDGSYFVADTGNHRVLRVYETGRVEVVAGTERAGYSGDGGPAATARLRGPTQVSTSPDGTLLIADTGNGAVRRVSSGVIETVTGGLRSPAGVVGLPDGAVVVASAAGLLRVEPNGTRVRIAGGPRRGYNGDSGPAGSLRFDSLGQIALRPDGSILFAEQKSDRIRVLSADRTVVETIAGSGKPIAIAAPDIPLRQAPSALFARSFAPAAVASQSGRASGCRRYNARFATFNLVPATRETLPRRPRRRIRFSFKTSRRARVVVQLFRSGARKPSAEKTRRSVPVKPRREPRRISVTLKKTGKIRGKYVVRLWGRDVANKVLRCDSRRVRVK